MYTHFETFNYHDDPIPFPKYEQCIICWETSNDINELNQMQLLPIFTKTCNCNSYFHNKCLFHWVIINESCPICHKILTIKPTSTKWNKLNILTNKIIIINIFKSIWIISQIVTYYILLKFFIFMFFAYIILQEEYTKQIQQSILNEDAESNAVMFLQNQSYL